MRITKEELQKIITESTGYRDASRKTGISHAFLRYWTLNYKIDTSHFLHGHHLDYLINTKHGLLIVKEILPSSGNKRRRFLRCLCDCGNERIVRSDSLFKTFSCGCKSKDRTCMAGNLNPAFKGTGEICSSTVAEMKRNAKRRNLDFALSIEYLWNLFLKQDRKCALTGELLTFGRLHRSWETTASLDRIDSNIGYIEGNVQWVLKEVNFAKGSLQNSRFIEICKMVALNNQ